jgi:hypothetical protein
MCLYVCMLVFEYSGGAYYVYVCFCERLNTLTKDLMTSLGLMYTQWERDGMEEKWRTTPAVWKLDRTDSYSEGEKPFAERIS